MDTDAFGVVFWIPDGRAPEKDTSRLTGFTTEEANRVADPESSLIMVKSVRYYPDTVPYRDSPEVVVANLTKLYGAQVLLGKDGDLNSLKMNDPPDRYLVGQR